MPSWNIHTAHVEALLSEHSARDLGILDVNDFLFGNFAPDVYVGYMVHNPTKIIRYRFTHLADADFIPAPRADEFWGRFISGRNATDVTLGAWAHLVCDHCYNLNTRRYIASIGVAPGERTRIRKQGDFDLFGRTLNISLMPRTTDSLLDECAHFPQYSIAATDVRAAVRAADSIVRRNALDHVDGVPEYSLLTRDFFASTFAEVNRILDAWLTLRACGIEPLGVPEVALPEASEVYKTGRPDAQSGAGAQGGVRQ